MAARVAITGKDYQIYRRSKCIFLYVCLQRDCPRNARNIGRFKPHMLEHGFEGVDHGSNECLLAELKNRWSVRTPRKLRARSVPTTKDFQQLKGSLKAVWTQTLKRKWRSFVTEAEHTTFFRFGPEPKPPAQTILTLVIDALLLLDRRTDAGFWAERWNFDLQECTLNACHKSTSVFSWCQTVENQLRLQEDQWPSTEISPKLRVATMALNGIFPQVLPIESEAVRAFMEPIRIISELIKSGQDHLEWVKATLLWVQNCSPKRINDRAKTVYQEWVKKSKATVLAKLKANLLHKFYSQFLVSEEETIEKAGLQLEEVFSDTEDQSTIAPDSIGVSEGSVCLEQPSNTTILEECGLQLTLGNSQQLTLDNNSLSTPDKWIVHAYSDDEEPFRRRLSTIYVNEDGVDSQPDGLWPSDATNILLSHVVRDMCTTFATQNSSYDECKK